MIGGKKTLKWLVLFLLAAVVGLVACQSFQATSVRHVIGVSVFSQENPELKMFMRYYKEYIEEGFPVKFYFSEELSSAEDEIAFIREMKDEGADGIISFYGLGIQEIIEACEEEEMFYVLGSGTLSEDDFQSVENSAWFLGSVGPKASEETRAGSDMAAHFADSGKKSYLILSGGSATGNYMHLARTEGMLSALQEKEGLHFNESVSELASRDTYTKIETGSDDVTITISPGYTNDEAGRRNLDAALADGSFDVLLSSMGISDVLDEILQMEKQNGHDIKIGVVDCFSEENFGAVKTRDAFGGPAIDYVEGKYASMAGPAFAALYNAMEGDTEVSNPEGSAFSLHQNFWTAGSREAYMELYGYTQGIYENAYSCGDLMNVIKSFNPDADFGQLKKLTEESDVESVKRRILEQDSEVV